MTREIRDLVGLLVLAASILCLSYSVSIYYIYEAWSFVYLGMGLSLLSFSHFLLHDGYSKEKVK